MKAAQNSPGLAWAALFAVLLAVRSLAPAGFMPAFGHGTVTIVACPDANLTSSTHMHGHDDHKRFHQPCPYVAASALGALAPDWAPLLALLSFPVALLLGHLLISVERLAARERPPSRAPPTFV